MSIAMLATALPRASRVCPSVHYPTDVLARLADWVIVGFTMLNDRTLSGTTNGVEA